ncbi:putative ribonuclease H-like domain-containing protein [Tanacetum coccineum]
MGKGLLGPNGESVRTIEGKFGEHCGGNDGIGGSKFGVGKGKVVSMGVIGGGAFAIRTIVSKDGQGGGGLVVDGGRSSRVSRKDWGEVGGVENNSSMGSRLMERGDVSLDGWSRLKKLVEDPKYSPMEVRMVDSEVMKFVDEPKKVIQELKDPSWTLVDLPNGKRAIGIKWVYKNKKDERGIVIKNKAILVKQGYTQEEGIDYDEVFAPS